MHESTHSSELSQKLTQVTFHDLVVLLGKAEDLLVQARARRRRLHLCVGGLGPPVPDVVPREFIKILSNLAPPPKYKRHL